MAMIVCWQYNASGSRDFSRNIRKIAFYERWDDPRTIWQSFQCREEKFNFEKMGVMATKDILFLSVWRRLHC